MFRRFVTDYRFAGVVIVLLTLLLGSSCSPPASPAERLESFLSSDPGCVAPCWQGLTPGISSLVDFDALVAASPQPQFADVRYRDVSTGGKSVVWYDEHTSSQMRTESAADSTIVYIGMTPDRRVTLATVLDRLGSPDRYVADVLVGDAGRILNLFMFYERSGIVIEIWQPRYTAPPSAEPPTCTVQLNNEWPVRELIMVEPQDATSMVNRLSRHLVGDEQPSMWQSESLLPLTTCR